jgi:hypothetical protein
VTPSLSNYLCEVRAGQFWRLEELKSFDEFLERRFPGSRRKAYYLMSIHEHLPPHAREQLNEVGWAKGLELAKLAKRDRQQLDCATSLHKARQMPKEDFKRVVEKELTGKETEPWEIIYFKLYQSQIPVVERAIETAALMLGSERSRGYCLEMICADFQAGANLDHGDPEMLLFSMTRFFKFLPEEQRKAFLADLSGRCTVTWISPNAAAVRLDRASYEILRQRVLRRDGWRCQSCGTTSNLEVHHKQFRSHSGDDSEENLITLCVGCHGQLHCLRRDGHG